MTEQSARTRDRRQTEERILAAVGQVLARDGFGAVGINAIAREAGVDKVLIYRYFGGLSELLQRWGASSRFWPRLEELFDGDLQAALALPLAERYAQFFERFIDALRARPLTLEVMAAEIVQRNELAAILEAEREQWGAQAEAVLGGVEFQRLPHLHGITITLIAGVQYLLVRSRSIRVFGGIDLGSDGGWQLLKTALRANALALLSASVCAPAPAPAPTAASRRAAAARLPPRPHKPPKRPA